MQIRYTCVYVHTRMCILGTNVHAFLFNIELSHHATNDKRYTAGVIFSQSREILEFLAVMSENL